MMHPGGSDLYRTMIGSSFFPGSIDHHHQDGFCDSSESAQERALVALRNHKEAEKRRRERINSHLDKLRSILPCSSKTDKASLLANVVERVRALKEEAAMVETMALYQSDHAYCVVPSESDEVTVYSSSDGGGRLVFKASLCCEDRSDLMPELTGILKSLRLRTVKGEMCTVSGRMRNVLMVAADSEHSVESVQILRSALKGLVQRPSGSSGSGNERSKRRRIVAQQLRS